MPLNFSILWIKVLLGAGHVFPAQKLANVLFITPRAVSKAMYKASIT